MLSSVEQSQDGTTKFLFEKGHHCVLIPHGEKMTLCVSSQVGCAMGCEFCLTAKIGFKENLLVQEIIEQFEESLKHLTKKQISKRGKNTPHLAHEFITSIVFMGMGEPLNNLDNVIASIEKLQEDYFYPYKKITVSTSGIAPAMKTIMKKIPSVHLALSFHAPFQAKRDNLMPFLSRWKIPELVEVCNEYSASRKEKMMIEYIMIKGLTDTKEDLEELLELGFDKMTNFNLIPLNGSMKLKGKEYFSSSNEKCLIFKDALRKEGYKCFIRQNMGEDIEAACGMLN